MKIQTLALSVLAALAIVGSSACTADTPSSQPSPNPATSQPNQDKARWGTSFYLSPVAAGKVGLYSRTGDGPLAKLAAFDADPGRMFELTVTVSPDGSRLAWISGTNQLTTSKVDGSDRRVLAATVQAALCARPVWSPDSRKVIFPGTVEGNARIINIDGSGLASTKTPYPCDHISLSDGAKLAWSAHENDKSYLVIGDIQSGKQQRFFSAENLLRVVTVSPDAKRAVVVIAAPDKAENAAVNEKQQRYSTYPARSVQGSLLDVTTGKVQRDLLPGDLLYAEYQKDGNLLLRTTDNGEFTLTIVDGQGAVVAEIVEPYEARTYSLLAYVP